LGHDGSGYTGGGARTKGGAHGWAGV
jgi:hypothetical protein